MCNVCNCIFKNAGALASHCKWKHSPVVQPVESAIGRMHTCLDCGNAYDSEEGLVVHRHVEHPDVYHAARQPAARVKPNGPIRSWFWLLELSLKSMRRISSKGCFV